MVSFILEPSTIFLIRRVVPKNYDQRTIYNSKLRKEKKNLLFLCFSGTTLTWLKNNNPGKIDGNGHQASFNGPQGIYFDSSSRSLFVTDSYFFYIRKMNQSGLLL